MIFVFGDPYIKLHTYDFKFEMNTKYLLPEESTMINAPIWHLITPK